MVFSGGVLWSLMFATALARTCGVAALSCVPIAFQVLIPLYLLQPRAVEAFIPLDGDYIQDVRGARGGVDFSGMRFGWKGENTALLESHLGPIQPQWKHSCSLSFGVRDGNERVDSRSIIQQEFLGDLLALLRDDEARRMVLKCVTDPTNLLRVHQGLLLVCVYQWGYPPGHDAASWWTKHRWVFYAERDPHQAWRVMWGWREKIEAASRDHEWPISSQLHAAYDQEGGAWGGDRKLGELFDREPFWRLSPQRPKVQNLGVDQLDWWP
jgi:hypothetical protein